LFLEQEEKAQHHVLLIKNHMRHEIPMVIQQYEITTRFVISGNNINVSSSNNVDVDLVVVVVIVAVVVEVVVVVVVLVNIKNTSCKSANIPRRILHNTTSFQ